MRDEIIERFWVAPDGIGFFVPDKHQDWIKDNDTVLDKYKVAKKDRTRAGLMKNQWVRIKKVKNSSKHRKFDMMEIQFNLNRVTPRWVANHIIYDSYYPERSSSDGISQVIKNCKKEMEILIANFDEKLLDENVFLSWHKSMFNITEDKIKQFLKTYKEAILNQII